MDKNITIENNSRRLGPGRPLRGNKKRIRTSFTLPPDLVEWLRTEAIEKKMSNSEVLEEILANAQDINSPCKQKSINGTQNIQISVPKEQVNECCKTHFVKKLSLFGSVLREDYIDTDDLDVVVEFKEGYAPSLFDMLRLENQLSAIFHIKRVDLRSLNQLSLYLRDEVLKTSVPIFSESR